MHLKGFGPPPLGEGFSSPSAPLSPIALQARVSSPTPRPLVKALPQTPCCAGVWPPSPATSSRPSSSPAMVNGPPVPPHGSAVFLRYIPPPLKVTQSSTHFMVPPFSASHANSIDPRPCSVQKANRPM